jgi:RHS repeat-associated protein
MATDVTGAVVAGSETRYTPWGEVRTGGTLPTDRGFTSQRREATIGLSDYVVRFYDPYIGKFISPDSIVPGAGNPQAFNRFAMVLNNPLAYVDVDGHIPYPITIRSFAPFVAFGAFGSPGGAYHGDNRGYSTRTSVSSRVTQNIAFDTDLTTVQETARSDPSWLVVNPSDQRTAVPESQVTNPLRISRSGDTRTFAFGTWYGGGNPFVPLPGVITQIDVFASFTIVENQKARTLDINAVLVGDNFPATEAFISDPSGQAVFIGVGFYENDLGKDAGPARYLLGQNQRPISNMSLQIGLDSKGNFSSVRYAGRSYTLAQWNRLFTSANPHDRRAAPAK